MHRNYSSGSSSNVNFFLGKEVELTPAYGKKTLFVVGIQPVEEIQKLLDDAYLNIKEPVKHIFFGANHSYNPREYAEHERWENMIRFFLMKDYLCSLDIPVNQVEEFHESGLCEYDNFIPQIRVSIPYTKLWNYNTMIKIDDKAFKATNPGIWTHSLHNLMDRNVFTDWNEYNRDEIIK